MTKKPIKFYALALLAMLLCCGLFACDATSGTGSTDGEKPDTGETGSTSVIKSLTAKEESVALKVGDEILLSNYYDITGFQPLKTAQKACDYESSDPTVVEINGKKAMAKSAGAVTITVTSQKDSTKTCSFDVVVSKVFFDREVTYIPTGETGDDFTNEWSDANQTGSIRTTSAMADLNAENSANYYYAADVLATKWYIETTITVNNYLPLDGFPKVGIVASNKGTNYDETMVAFFFNLTPGLGTTQWNEFGVCEVSKGGHWAWEEGIPNSLARHHDYCWNSESFHGVNNSFKLGVARDGLNFHVWINDKYVGSHRLSTDLDILYEGGQVLESHAGFFYFSVDATFSDYKVSTDNQVVNAKIPTTDFKYVHDVWANAEKCGADGYLIDAA